MGVNLGEGVAGHAYPCFEGRRTQYQMFPLLIFLIFRLNLCIWALY